MILELVFGIIDLILILGYVLWDYLKIYTTKEQAFQWFVVYQFTILIVYLLARSSADRRRTTSAVEDIKLQIANLERRVTHNTIALRQDEFYADFRRQILQASGSVDITYLDTRPPGELALRGSEWPAPGFVDTRLS